MRISDWSSDVCSSDLLGNCRDVLNNAGLVVDVLDSDQRLAIATGEQKRQGVQVDSAMAIDGDAFCIRCSAQHRVMLGRADQTPRHPCAAKRQRQRLARPAGEYQPGSPGSAQTLQNSLSCVL